MVRSQLEYCCPLWHPHKVGDIQKLENIQRNFTRKIYGLSRLHYWDRLKALNLMSLQRRRERYIVLHMWKILNDQILNDLKIVFRPPSRTGIRAVIPPLNRVSRQFNVSLYENSFAVVGPKLWNTIPANLTTIHSQDSFKNKLTSWMKGLPDEPPVDGYVRRHRNTLMEVGPAGSHEY